MAGSRSGGPVAPVRAIFHDVVPAQKRDVPDWMKKGGLGSASSMPPGSAAALLEQPSRARTENDNADFIAEPPPARTRVSGPSLHGESPSDPLLEARIKNASLAAEVSESWTPPPTHEDPVPQTEEAMTELRTAISALAAQQSALLGQLEPQILALTRLVAERVIENQIPGDDQLPIRLVKEGLKTLDHGGAVTVILGPGFSAQAPRLEEELTRDGIECDIQVHDHLALYACQVRTELGVVDESVETRLDKIIASLMDSEDGV